MEAELSTFSRENKELMLEMEKQQLRLDATSKEMKRERQLVSNTNLIPRPNWHGSRTEIVLSETHGYMYMYVVLKVNDGAAPCNSSAAMRTSI